MTFPSRRIGLWAAVITAAIFLPLGARAYRTASIYWKLCAAPLPSLPAHTVTLLETTRCPGLTSQRTIIYARRGDGSGLRIFREADPLSSTGNTETKSIQMSNGVFVDSLSSVGMKTTRVWGPTSRRVKEDLLILRDPGTNCTKSFLGRSPSRLKPISETMDTVEGYPALKTVDDPGDGVWTVWRAPAFGCDIVKQHVAFKGGGYSDQLPKQLQLGEPDPALFDVSGLKEVSPLEMAMAGAKLHHRSLPPAQAAFFKKFESKYQLLRPKAR